MFLHFSNDAQMNFQINRALMSVLSEPALPSQTDENARTLACLLYTSDAADE